MGSWSATEQKGRRIWSRSARDETGNTTASSGLSLAGEDYDGRYGTRSRDLEILTDAERAGLIA